MGNIKAKTHLEKLGFVDPDKNNPEHNKIQEWAYHNMKQILDETFLKNYSDPYEIIQKEWEYAVSNRTGYSNILVGHIDLMINLKGKFYDKNSLNHDRIENCKTIFVEIKTAIPDLGALIRQMRAYQFYQGDSTEYLIVSPDDRHKKILYEQGFWFYKYQDQGKLF